MALVPVRRFAVYLCGVCLVVVHVGCGDAGDSAEGGSPSDEPDPPGGEAVLDRQLRPLLQAHEVDPPDTQAPYDTERVELGRKLFFDKALSGNEDVACASCHHTRKGAETSDGLALGVGTGGEGSIPDRRTPEGHEFEPRHSLGLFNLGFEGWRTQFWDGRVQRTASGELVNPKGDQMLEGFDDVVALQAMLPVTSRVEMRGFPEDPNPLARIPNDRPREIWSALMDRLLGYDGYRELFAEAYPSKDLDEMTFREAAKALAEFQKSAFTYVDAPFDEYLRGDEEALTREQKQGGMVFFGRGGCAGCHSGTLTTDQKFHNIAVPQIGPGKGGTKSLDPGRAIVTGRPSQRFAFRTPSLRNCELTPPYMHSGAYESIEKAIEHHLDPRRALAEYDGSQLRPEVRAELHNSDRVQERLLDRLDPKIRGRAQIQRQLGHPLRITDRDVDRLVAFLRSLTSPTAGEQLDEAMPESVPSGMLEDGREAP